MASAADHELPAASHWVLGRKPGPKGIAVNIVLTSKGVSGCWLVHGSCLHPASALWALLCSG